MTALACGAYLLAVMGTPMALAASDGAESDVIRLSPRMRILPPEASSVPVDISALERFLAHHRIIEGLAEDIPAYIVSGSQGRLINGAGDQVLARHVNGRAGQRFGVYAPGNVLTGNHGDVLGQVMIHIGQARLERPGTPLSTLTLESSRQEIGEGARLLPLDDWTPPAFLTPHPARPGTTGRILDKPGAGRVVGLRDVVVIDQGCHQVDPGTLLRAYGADQPVTDPVTKEGLSLPGASLGHLLVVRCLEKTSLAVVNDMALPMAIDDRLEVPTND